MGVYLAITVKSSKGISLLNHGWIKGGKRFDVKDNQFGSHDYAFSKPDGSIYSYSPVAVDFVGRVLGMDESMVEMLQPGKCYRIMTDGAYGDLLEVQEFLTR